MNLFKNKTFVTVSSLFLFLLSSLSADSTTLTGTAGGDDNWNVGSNWTNGVPNLSKDVVIQTNVAAKVNNASTPTYSGSLVLESGSSVLIYDSSGSANALNGASSITMNSNTTLLININSDLNLPSIVLNGNAKIESVIPKSDWENTHLSSISGAHALTLKAFNGHSFYLNQNNTFTEFISEAHDRHRIYAKSAGAFGSGNVTINGRASDGRSAQLHLDVADTISDFATLTLNGKGFDSNNDDRITIAAGVNEQVSALIVDGVSLAPGTYTNSEAWLSGSGSITVTPLVPGAPKGELDILDLTANGGLNPATNQAWEVGDKYRFVFVSSAKTAATSTDLSTYDSFLQGLADSASIGGTWKVLGSSDTVDAKDHSSSNPSSDPSNIPVILIDGSTVIANNYQDLWDGSLDAKINRDELGNTNIVTSVHTGTSTNGTKRDRHLGGSDEGTPKVTIGNSDRMSGQWTVIYNSAAATAQNFYAISEPLTIVATGVPVNTAPVANAQSVTLDENSNINITLTGSDAEGDALTYSIVTNPSQGSLSGTAPNLTYTPNANYSGNDSFTFKVNDGNLDSANVTVSIQVNDVNYAPSIDVAASATPSTILQSESTTVSVTASDVDGDTLTYSWVKVSGPGAVTFTSASSTQSSATFDTSGSYSLRVDVSDGQLQTSSTVAVTVNDPNPIGNPKGELDILDLTANGGLNPATNQAWAIGDQYRLVFVSSGQRSADTTDLSVYDSYLQGLADTAGIGGTWKVLGSSDSVDAKDHTSSNPSTDGSNIPVLLINGSTVIANNYQDLWDGGIDAKINQDEQGNANIVRSVFTGTSSDGTKRDRHLGGSDEGTPKVTIGSSDRNAGQWTVIYNSAASSQLSLYAISEPLTIVSDVVANTPPQANPQSVTTLMDTAKSITLNATDAEGSSLSYSIVSYPTNGTLTGAPPQLLYTPNNAFVGNDTFTFKANDSQDDSNIATVSIQVDANIQYLAGLWYGELSGDINTSDPNPNTFVIANVSSETENNIGGTTTEVYTGEIYDADGNISFTEQIDDKTRIYINGSLVLSDDVWHSRKSTTNLNLTPGWNQIEIRISNGGGGSGPSGSPGIGFDPNGGTNWQVLNDPGDASLLRADSNANQNLSPLEPVHWSGLGADNNWSTAENWGNNQVPGVNSEVKFDATSNKDCIIDINVNVGALHIKDSFGGKVYAGSAVISVNRGDFSAEAFSLPPRFDAQTSTIKFIGGSAIQNLKYRPTETFYNVVNAKTDGILKFSANRETSINKLTLEAGTEIDLLHSGIDLNELVINGASSQEVTFCNGQINLLNSSDVQYGRFTGIDAREGKTIYAGTSSQNLKYNANVVFATLRVWDGGGSNNNWTTAANWSGDVAPTTGDSVLFPNGVNKNCNLNTSVQVNSLEIESGYTGTLTLGNHTLSVSSVLNQYGGSITSSNGKIDLNGATDQTVSLSSASQLDLSISNSSAEVCIKENITIDNLILNGGSTLEVMAGKTITASALNTFGSLENPIRLISTTSGETFNLNLIGSPALAYVYASDCHATGASVNATNNCIDGGNNTNWSFGNGAGNMNLVISGSIDSYVSPACVEGRLLTPTTNSMKASVGNQDYNVTLLSKDQYFFNLPLQSSATTSAKLTLSGTNEVSKDINVNWLAIDLNGTNSNSNEITIRQNDKLLFTCSAGGESFRVDHDGNGSFGADQALNAKVQADYSAAGSYTVTCQVLNNGTYTTIGTYKVNVASASIGLTANQKGFTRAKTVSVSSNEHVELDTNTMNNLYLDSVTETSSQIAFNMKPNTNNAQSLILRTKDSNLIVASQAIDIFEIETDSELNIKVIEVYEDGSYLLQEKVTLSPKVPNLQVKLLIFVGGVTFDNYGLNLDLNSNDFDMGVDGTYATHKIYLIKDTSVQPGPCHRTEVYQNNVMVGKIQ